ncbi:MAG TPA: hypothetical protein VK970_18415 [Candidatus Methylacidiphilales bacterium]|nr:hypothetical protein [Candidatus Methylacidiphilales bacterium]
MNSILHVLSSRKARRSGMVLVITLAAVLLLSILVLTFFSRANLNRQISFSGTNLVKVDVLARSSLDVVVGELRNEIADPTRSDVTTISGISTYKPKTSAEAFPVKSGVVAATGSVLKVSANNISFYPGSTLKGSSVPISQASLNGRRYTAARWFTSPTSPQLGSQATVPTWHFLTRGSGIRTPAIADARNTQHNDFVVGRFAYTVYDVSGLLDINVAGYPTSAAGAAKAKGSAVWADLTRIPGMNDTDGLAQWIHASTKADFANFATQKWPASGFRKAAENDTAFLSRGDLIRYSQANPGRISSTALPYLTTFSRELNAPSNSPAKDLGGTYNYKTNANAAASINRYFPNVRVKSAFTRRDGTPALVGEPLVSQRFALSKLSSLTLTATATADSDIEKNFGLTRAAASDAWTYRNNATAILTLDQVAALTPAREPDFFELLQACMLNGSLGKYGALTLTNTVAPDSNSYLQVIRIGANIIDQADTDNYPTIISFNSYKLAGIEDIPYPNEVLMKWISTAPYTTGFTPEVFFEMWNPHQPSGTAGPGPTQFRIIPNTGARYQIGFVNPVSGGYHSYVPIGTIPTTAVTYTASSGTYGAPGAYREPAVITGGSPSLSFPISGPRANGYVLSAPPITQQELNWYLGLNGTVASNPYGKWQYYWTFIDTIFSFQYQSPSGQWVTYATSGGLEELPTTGLKQTTKWVGGDSSGNIAPALTGNNDFGGSSIIHSDPRTCRFGMATGKSSLVSGSTTYFSGGSSIIPATGVYMNAGQDNPWGPYTYVFRLDLWSQNKSTSDSTVRYTDRDNAMRPGDCYLSDSNQPMIPGQTAARSIILNRPFRSVGELGYVFRDMPWKTIDLFSPDSADAALLDVFSVEDSRVVAGRVNPNTPYTQVLSALFSGANSREVGGTAMTTTQADATALAILTSTQGAGGPILNAGDLVTRFTTVTAAFPATGKMDREALVRTLGSAVSTRTWNVMIDLVAQSGRYAPNAGSLNDFYVDGERRYWLHVAIDRYTGEIVDQSIETVDE